MAVRFPEASSVRRRKRRQSDEADGKPGETVSEKRGAAQQGRRRDGAPRGAPCFREGTRALKEQWLRHLARHPPRICAGERRSERRRAYPGSRQRIRVMAHGCFKLAV